MPGEHIYSLQVVGGNAQLDRAFVTVGDFGSAEVRPQSRTSNQLRLTYSPEAGILRSDDPGTSGNDICMLSGPSGKGEYKLEIGQPSESTGMSGGTSLENDWLVLEDHGRLLLRHRQDENTSCWIAVSDKDENNAEVWSFWWYSPSAANMNDFESYVVVDLELEDATSMHESI